MALSALISILPALLCPTPAQTSALDLLEELTAEPRIAGTPGYDRALAIVERELRAAGRDVTRQSVRVTGAVPTRSDVLLFEDAIATSAFAGLRETWNPEAVPTAALPPAYVNNRESADVRGPVVDVGAGASSDYERLAGMRITLAGSVALVHLERSPAARTTTVRELAERAREAGCIALLVAPRTPGPTVDDFVLEDTHNGDGPLSLAAAPVRTIEANEIRARLRVKRVRGDDGKAVSLQVGPGPVEVGVRIECRVSMDKGLELICGGRSASSDESPERLQRIDLDERPGQILGGAPAVVAAILACRREPWPGGAGARIVFGYRHTPTTGPVPAPFEGALAPTNQAFGPSRLPPEYGETVEGLSARLGDELLPRLDAASAWIAYSLITGRPMSPLPANRDSGVAGFLPEFWAALDVLLAPLPTSGPHPHPAPPSPPCGPPYP